jgi:hypothetical protein
MRKGIIAIGNDHFTSIPAGWNAQIAVIHGPIAILVQLNLAG